MDSLNDVYESATLKELADGVQNSSWKCIDLIDAFIVRHEKTHKNINALIQYDFERARQVAHAMDEEHANGGVDFERKPFFGVPCSIKDNLSVSGLTNSAGLVKRKNSRNNTDAEVVHRMRDAGFIVMGTTNVPEALLWYDTDNKLYGRTYNPFDKERTPGGSSGGEAALVGSGVSPVGIGGDIGGSIRNPANFCGVVGHKPSGGLISERGAWGAKPEASLLKQFKVVGPLARYVEDIEALMPLLVGDDGWDLNTQGAEWQGVDEALQPSDLEVYWYDDLGTLSPDREVRLVIQETLDALKKLGAKITYWRPPNFEHSFKIYVAALKNAGSFRYDQRLGDGEPINLKRAWLDFCLGRSPHIFPSLALATYESMLDRKTVDRSEYVAMREELVELMRERLTKRAVIIAPSWPRIPPKIGFPTMLEFFGFTYCGIYNVLEMPATVVPWKRSSTGLPIGIQIAGAPGDDALTLRVASWVEKASQGHR